MNNHEKGTILKRLKAFNTREFYDLLINFNADILTHTATKEGFEGADEAAKFYRRNLRIYSNLNKIPLTKNDRVFYNNGSNTYRLLKRILRKKSEI